MALRVRWADGPDDAPRDGEALARLWLEPAGTERIPGAGLRGTDLIISRNRTFLSVSTADGRNLVARFGSDVDAPQVDVDADRDLTDAIIRAWTGRPDNLRGTTVSGDDEIRSLVAELRSSHRRVTLASIAAASGTFTRDNLRYYLLRNKRRLADYL